MCERFDKNSEPEYKILIYLKLNCKGLCDEVTWKRY